jgi:hypothetical protein
MSTQATPRHPHATHTHIHTPKEENRMPWASMPTQATTPPHRHPPTPTQAPTPPHTHASGPLYLGKHVRSQREVGKVLLVAIPHVLLPLAPLLTIALLRVRIGHGNYVVDLERTGYQGTAWGPHKVTTASAVSNIVGGQSCTRQRSTGVEGGGGVRHTCGGQRLGDSWRLCASGRRPKAGGHGCSWQWMGHTIVNAGG